MGTGGGSPANSNFAFLQTDWPEVFAEARQAERLTLVDPRTSCFYSRRTLERLVGWLHDADRTLRPPYRDDLNARLHEPTFTNLVGQPLLAKMNLIRKQGNLAVHGKRQVSDRQSLAVLRELFQVTVWLGRHYARTRESLPAAGVRLDVALLPQPGAVPTLPRKTQAELRDLAQQLAAKDAELAEERRKSAYLDAQIAQLRDEIAAAKAAHAARPDTHDYDEQHTRDAYIDMLLAEAGWPLDGPDDREYPVTGLPSPSGKGRVDYVPWGDDGKPLAVVEAKRAKRDARDGQEQAKRYADCLEGMFGQRPLIYYSNGYEHYFWDDLRYPPRTIQGFHTKDELQLIVHRRSSRRSLAETAINDDIVARHYQVRAIRRIAATFEEDHQRRALVVMATGAGKTRTVVALVDLLMRCNWVKRVLFLADRIALVNQAVGAFKRHLPDSSPVNLVGERDPAVLAGARVFVSTYPTMMNLIESPDRRQFGVGFFDLVVIDEAHRSVYQKYRAIFSYFDAILVGLTATPRDEIDYDTYGLFNLEPGVPTDAYPLDDAIADGYLVPYRRFSVPLKIPQQGLRYRELSEEEKARWESLDWGDDGDIPDEVDAEEVNKWLFNADTVDKVLGTLMEHGIRVAGGDRLGKTIIFAKNDNHARFIAERFDANYPHYRGVFAKTITHSTEYAQSVIDDFSVADRAPHIAISVDMMDTGIDVPEVVNLVFFKTVRSKTKFWQMIGRGTRLCPDLFGPGRDKREFFIFDFCRNFEFFEENPDAVEGRLGVPLGQRLFRARLDLIAGLDRDEHTGEPERALRRDTADLLHRIVAGMNVDNVLVRPHRRWVEAYSRRDAWESLDDTALAEIEEHLSNLPSSEHDEDEEAKRFDLLMLRAQLCVLNAEPGFVRFRDQVREIADALLTQTSIPAIAAHAELLEELATEQWWTDVTLPMLERVRLRVRGLVRLIERAKRRVVYTDFADELGEITESPYVGASGQVDMDRFRAKVRDFLSGHQDHIALHKLRRNLPLTQYDLSELERILFEAEDLDQEALRRSIDEARGLGPFIRSLVGLDRPAAKEALSGFIQDNNLSAVQIEFINMIVEHLTRHGIMDASQLYEPPFTDLTPTGPDVIFPTERLRELTIVLEDVRARASAS